MAVRLEQRPNAYDPMPVTFAPIAAPVRLVQASNANCAMLVTLSGMVTLVRPEVSNAFGPMLVTGKPLVELGITTTRLVAIYAVMVMAPLFVVRMNWACTEAGSANSASAANAWIMNR